MNLHGMIAANLGGGGFGGAKRLNLGSLRRVIDKAFAPDRLEEVLVSVNSPGTFVVELYQYAYTIVRV